MTARKCLYLLVLGIFLPKKDMFLLFCSISVYFDKDFGQLLIFPVPVFSLSLFLLYLCFFILYFIYFLDVFLFFVSKWSTLTLRSTHMLIVNQQNDKRILFLSNLSTHCKDLIELKWHISFSTVFLFSIRKAFVTM